MPKKSVSCPVETTLGILSGRWTVMIIHQLLEGTKRFNQLQRELSGITHRTLSKQLRQMEADGMVRRIVHHQVPPKVEYALTARGQAFCPTLDALPKWVALRDQMADAAESEEA